MAIGTIRPVSIDAEMRDSYLDYAMSVIVARALPDARDGLKPVHRRILYAMHDMGLRPNSAYKKSARIVGEVLGKYHPHGDAAVYESMARLAQDFSMRYPLVDGQGNFGSVDGDSPAAMRYTEARLARIAEELLLDLNMDTVNWGDNFDGSLQEPDVLPAKLPNLLLNGSSGIAVGMATNIPPHNLRELNDAISYVIDNWSRLNDISVDELMQFVHGPDFPTGAVILASDEMREMYATGRGRVIVRASAEIEEMKGGERHRIVFTSIPYQLNKVSVIERIAQLVKEGKLEAISDLRDESDRRGMRIVVELKKNAQPKKVLNQLYKFTQLQSTFSVQMLALVHGEPKTIGLKRALQLYIEHRFEVITRRSRFELKQARARQHILEGYLKALTNIDRIIETIRRAEDSDKAREALMSRFTLSDAQARAILDLQLRRIASLERLKIEEEFKQVTERIAFLEDLLAHDQKILSVIKVDLQELTNKFGDERKTALDFASVANFEESDLIRDEEVLISLTQRGYIKRTPSALYRAQHRGGRGYTGMATREEDTVEHIVSANSLTHILFFTTRGKVYAERTFNIPEADRNAKGTLINSLIALEPEERITAIACVDDFESGHFVLCTQRGKIKRVPIEEFSSVRSNGLIAIGLNEDDTLRWVRRSSGDDHILIVTARGRAIRFEEHNVRVLGRQAMGVNSIRLREGDKLAGVDVISPAVSTVLVVTARGYGKQTPVEQYPVRGRRGQGVLTIAPRVLPKVGEIVSAHALIGGEDITLITADGMALRTRSANARLAGRATQGVRLIRMSKNDAVVSVAVVEGSPEEKTDNDLIPGENGASDGDAPHEGEILDIEADDELDLIDDAELDAEDELLDEEDLGDDEDEK